MAFLLTLSILLPLLGVWYIFTSRKSRGTPVPLVEFDGDNSPARYENDTVTVLLGKGYEEVCECQMGGRGSWVLNTTIRPNANVSLDYM